MLPMKNLVDQTPDSDVGIKPKLVEQVNISDDEEINDRRSARFGGGDY